MIPIIKKTIEDPNKALKEINYRLFSLIGHTNFVRFIVLTRSRTGSNLLMSFLNSHPNIRGDNEIFAKINGKPSDSILNKTFSKQPYFIKAKGFKIFYYHPLDSENDPIWKLLETMEDLFVIHLKRRNILRTIISRKIAGVQGIWAKTSSDKSIKLKNKSVTFTKDELFENFTETRKWEEDGDKSFNKHPKITIYYEDLVKNPNQVFGIVTEFLGVKNIEPKTKLKKQNPENLSSLVKNYDGLKLVFEGTEWQSFFEE